MASVVAIRNGLADRLRTITDLNVQATVGGAAPVPAAIIEPATDTVITYVDIDGSADINLTVLLLVNPVISEAAQTKLDGYIATSGPDSVKAAIDTDPTLGGAVDYATLNEVRSYGSVNYGGSEYVGCEFSITVRASL